MGWLVNNYLTKFLVMFDFVKNLYIGQYLAMDRINSYHGEVEAGGSNLSVGVKGLNWERLLMTGLFLMSFHSCK